MKKIELLICAIVSLSSMVLAQNPSESVPPSMGVPWRGGHHVGCWQQAGISRSVAEQGKEIERSTGSQIAAVCSDSSVNLQQRNQQARQLHEKAREQIRGLLSEQQAQAFLACREQREGGHGGVRRGGGPCGRFDPADPSSETQPSSQPSPSEPAPSQPGPPPH